MGTDRGQEDERPPHRVFIDRFELAVFPVTRAEYASFADATGHERPPRLVPSAVCPTRLAGRGRQLARCDGVLRVAIQSGSTPGPIADGS